jgi:hypothetical protein
MNHELQTITRLLKGSSAKGQIVMTFIFMRAINGMDIDDLKAWTNNGREAIYHACDELERAPLGLLTHIVNAHGAYRWYPSGAMLPIIRELNHGAPELPGAAMMLDAGVLQSIQESSQTTPGALNVVDVESKTNCPTITTTTTTTRIQESSQTTPGNKILIASLNEHQITGRKRRELLDAADREENPITPEYIQAHIDQAKADIQNWDNPVGVAINRMLDGLPAPEISNNGHPRDCQCTKCKVDRFVNGGGGSRTIDRGKRRGTETNSYSRDLLIAVSEFMEHDPGCDCFDCQMARLTGVGSLCPNCKHYNCECPDESEET